MTGEGLSSNTGAADETRLPPRVVSDNESDRWKRAGQARRLNWGANRIVRGRLLGPVLARLVDRREAAVQLQFEHAEQLVGVDGLEQQGGQFRRRQPVDAGLDLVRRHP